MHCNHRPAFCCCSSDLFSTIIIHTCRSARCGYIIYCLFVFRLFVFTVTDFSGKDKANGVKFCTVVHGRPWQEISHFGELCSLTSLKSDESASHHEVGFHKGRHTTNVTLELRHSWNMARRVDVGRHVWIYVSSH